MIDSPSHPVRPFIRVIANGREPGKAKVTLIVTPEPWGNDAPAPDGYFDLRDWPERVAALLRRGEGPFCQPHGIAIKWRPIEAGNLADNWQPPLMAHAAAHAACPPNANWKIVGQLWQHMFECIPRDPWALLCQDLQRSQAAEKHQPGNATYTPPAVTDQSKFASKFDKDGAILARRPDANHKAVICGVVPIQQADFAIDEESIRAARILAKARSGPTCINDTAPTPPEPSTIPTKAQVADARQVTAWKRYIQAVAGTRAIQEENEKARLLYQNIVDGLQTDGECPMSGRFDIVPPTDAVTGSADRTADQASHVYGAWPQRTPEYSYDTIMNQDGGVEQYKLKNIPDDKTQAQYPPGDMGPDEGKIRALYYAVQGDPILSRLFCLTVDLEIDTNAPFDTGGGARCIFLAPETGQGISPPTGLPLIVTAAKLDADGFWPVSQFEAGVVRKADSDELMGINARCLVEQSMGVWSLGDGYNPQHPDQHRPRYDLVSIDIRRAVDAKASVDGRSAAGIDRGERHQTAGFTILDRGRSKQIARDLALTGKHMTILKSPAADQPSGASRCIILFAEELTIGRRVDIAVCHPGRRTPGKPVTWRSLMYRLVRFPDLEPAIASVLSALAPKARGAAGYIEEASFLTSARYMPLLTDDDGHTDGTSYEAVAEEAIFTWDGTPLAVLTSQAAVGKDLPLKLPFTRVYSLPSSATSHSDLRPPPLRFGVGYLFGFRSAFLGGGSPPVEKAARGDADTLPPATTGQPAPPRRFLRHEGVSAPTLMFTALGAVRQLGPMGFEQLDQAILRSATGIDTDRLPERRDPALGPKIDLGMRLAPSTTCRVFIPPEAGFESVVRHGMLDPPGTAARVFRGGLRDVDYDPWPLGNQGGPDGDATKSTMRGFPAVVTRETPSLEPGAATSRQRLEPGQHGETGIPIFQPGGANLTPEKFPGFLPDPAIGAYCVRARLRGSDRYLAGHVAVPLYPGPLTQHYPNLLPLVVVVTQQTQSRPAQVEHINELTGAPDLVWMARDETFRPTRAWPGTQVQRLTFALAPGEDFDLEVSCPPDATTLCGAFSVAETIAQQLAYVLTDCDSRTKLEGPWGKLPPGAPMDPNAFSGLGGLFTPKLDDMRGVADWLCGAMTDRWPIEEVAGVTRLRICHAINRPLTRPEWVPPTGQAVTVRRPDPAKIGDILNPTLTDTPGSSTWALIGTLQLDLEQIDAFEIIADVVAASGQPMDDRSRGRSLASRRSGRWPVQTASEGTRDYVPPRNVLGFVVGTHGKVELLRDRVSLLRVDNLPAHGAFGPPAPPPDVTGPDVAATYAKDTVCLGMKGRLTSLALGPLHAAAISGQKIDRAIAAPDGARDMTGRHHAISAIRPHVIPDTKARRLTLSIVGLSRLAPAFETAPGWPGGTPRQFTGRQALAPEEQSITSFTTEAWIPASERPAACDVLRPEPAFEITRPEPVVRIDSGPEPPYAEQTASEQRYSDFRRNTSITYIVTRRALTRLWFGRGWFSSGEGERVGIVLWPPDYFTLTEEQTDKNEIPLIDRTIKIDDFDDQDLGAGGAFITRWGGDPIRKIEKIVSGALIPPEAFLDAAPLGKEGMARRHAPEVVKRARMPVPALANDGAPNAAGSNSWLDVSLLTYEPYFDLDREEWFVDVDLRPGRGGEPFARFGLVRYQHHAINDELKVSSPVVVMTTLLPERCLVLTATHGRPENGVQVTVQISGYGSTDIKNIDVLAALPPEFAKEGPDRVADFERSRRPGVRLYLMHEVEDAAIGLLRTAVFEGGQIPGSKFIVPELNNASLEWGASFTIPANRLAELGSGVFVLYAEEIDRRMPASYLSEPVALNEMFNDETFLDSGPRFSARVPFYKV